MRISMPSPIRIGETFYLRVRVPPDVAAKARGKAIAVPTAEAVKTVSISDTVKISLQTKDPQEARRRFVSAFATVKAFWEADAVRSDGNARG
jgi:hypothetical protein